MMASSGHGREQWSKCRKQSSMKPLRMMMSVPDDRFAMETRLVVLNFMGLVPASCPASAAVSDGVRLEEQIGDGVEEMLSRSVMQHELWPPLEEDVNEMDDFQQDDGGKLDNNHCNNTLVEGMPVDGTSSEPSSTRVLPPTDSQLHFSIPAVHLLEGSPVAGEMSMDQLSMHLSTTSSQLLQTTSHLQLPISVSPYSVSPSLSPSVERQLSHRSSGSSTRSRMSGRRNSYVDVRLVDVESLVKTRSVTPLALPLRDELFRELDDRLTDEPGGAEGNSALTPESEVAEMLRILGDRVQEEFGEELQRAAAELLPQEPTSLSYSSVRDAALRMLGHSAPSWTQVVLVLLLGQRVAMSQLMRGEQCIGKLADYTTQFIGDHIADFIVRNGGWQSILDIDCDEMLLDDAGSRNSPPADIVTSENFDADMTDSTSNSLNASMDISSNLFDHETTDGVLLSDIHDITLPSGYETSTTNGEQSSESKSSDLAASVDACSTTEGAEKIASDVGAEGGTVYMTLCALAVAGACVFYQKLWKS